MSGSVKMVGGVAFRVKPAKVNGKNPDRTPNRPNAPKKAKKSTAKHRRWLRRAHLREEPTHTLSLDEAAACVADRRPFTTHNRFLAGSWQSARLYVVRQCATGQVWLFWDRDHGAPGDVRPKGDGMWVRADMSGPHRDPRDVRAMRVLTKRLPYRRVIDAGELTTHQAVRHGGYPEWKSMMEESVRVDAWANPGRFLMGGVFAGKPQDLGPPTLDNLAKKLSETPSAGGEDMDFLARSMRKTRVKRDLRVNDPAQYKKGWSTRSDIGTKMDSLKPFHTPRDEIRGRRTEGRFVVQVGAGLPVMLAYHDITVGGAGRSRPGTWFVTEDVVATIAWYVRIRRANMERTFLRGRFIAPVLSQARRVLDNMRGEKVYVDPKKMALQDWHRVSHSKPPVPGLSGVLNNFRTVCALRRKGMCDQEWDTSRWAAYGRAHEAAPRDRKGQKMLERVMREEGLAHEIRPLKGMV